MIYDICISIEHKDKSINIFTVRRVSVACTVGVGADVADDRHMRMRSKRTHPQHTTHARTYISNSSISISISTTITATRYTTTQHKQNMGR